MDELVLDTTPQLHKEQAIHYNTKAGSKTVVAV
jgi:hypothetical protein